MPVASVIGASPKPERYANRAVARLRAAGWSVRPVHPSGELVHGAETFRSLDELPEKPDLITIYVNAGHALPMVEAIAELGPRAVICNPGADDPEVVDALREKGLAVATICTLVALASAPDDETPEGFLERVAEQGGS